MKYRRNLPSIARCRQRSRQEAGLGWARCSLTLGHSGGHEWPSRIERWRLWKPRYVYWHDIPWYRARSLDLSVKLYITAPRNEMGERCPWPWQPPLLRGQPIGQYRCSYCYAMCVAGLRHIDYGDDWLSGIDNENPMVEERIAD